MISRARPSGAGLAQLEVEPPLAGRRFLREAKPLQLLRRPAQALLESILVHRPDETIAILLAQRCGRC